MEITQDNDENSELTHHDESWTVTTSCKKRKVSSCKRQENCSSIKKTMAAGYQAQWLI